jgi:hypothetical protein
MEIRKEKKHLNQKIKIKKKNWRKEKKTNKKKEQI